MMKVETSMHKRSPAGSAIRVQSPAGLFFFLFLCVMLIGSSCIQDNTEESPVPFVLGDSDSLLDCDGAGDGEQQLACQLAYYTNRERQNHPEESDDAHPVNWSANLAEVALDYSNRMCEDGFFDHKDSQGRNMESRLQEAGVFYIKAGENLARGTELYPDEAMSLFMNEPSCQINHRGNVLDNDFTHTGVGTVFCGGKTIYTQLFATFDAEDLREDSNDFCS